MEWVTLITGGISTLFGYLLFATNRDEEIEEDGEDMYDDGSELVVNDFSSRHVTLSCQTCRKLKKHKEVKPNLFQCVKCKRHTDLRRVS